tara:strand:- start:305 stop:1210 length:906 start_codon:yes stop_codon:yes gene_type:complete
MSLPRLEIKTNGLNKFTRSVSLITYGYNEELLVREFLENAVKMLSEVAISYELIFIDDGSTDKTNEIVKEFSENNQGVYLFTNETNKGTGYSFLRAVKEAKNDFIFWQMVDWCYDLKNIRTFLELTNYYDIIVGIRPSPVRLVSHIPVIKSVFRVKSRADNFWRAIVSLGNYYIIKILFGANFHDFQNVHIYPKDILQNMKLSGESSFLSPEALIRAQIAGKTFIEVPIGFFPRRVGDAKGFSIKNVSMTLRDIMKVWLSWGWRYRLKIMLRKSNISRVSEPFKLEEEPLRLIATLLREYR